MLIYAIVADFNHQVARKDLGRIQKNETASCFTDRSVVSVDTVNRLTERNAKENILKIETLPIVPFLIDFYERYALNCYSFHEKVPRQCRFRIPSSTSKRVYRIKG